MLCNEKRIFWLIVGYFCDCLPFVNIYLCRIHFSDKFHDKITVTFFIKIPLWAELSKCKQKCIKPRNANCPQYIFALQIYTELERRTKLKIYRHISTLQHFRRIFGSRKNRCLKWSSLWKTTKIDWSKNNYKKTVLVDGVRFKAIMHSEDLVTASWTENQEGTEKEKITRSNL